MISVYGIIAIEDTDNVNEKFVVEGCDISVFNDSAGRVVLTRTHDQRLLDGAIGYALEAETFLEEPQGHWKALWTFNGSRPFVGVQARIFDPLVERLLDCKVRLYFGVGGVVLEKKQDGDVCLLTKTKLNQLIITDKPAHTAYRVWTW